MAKRLTIVLEDSDAEMLLRLAGHPRKQSEVLAQLIRAASTRREVLALNPIDDEEALATTAFASEAALAANWLRPEEDEAWRDL